MFHAHVRPRRTVRVLVFLLLGTFSLLLQARGAEEPKKVALLVGVNRYRTRILVDKPLQYAERDVTELAAVLKAQRFQVETLTGASATKAAIDQGLKRLLAGRAASDLVLLGFAGHGVQMALVDGKGEAVLDAFGRTLGDAYFCPVNAVFGDGTSMISLTRLFERLNREGGVNLLLVDACRDNPDPARGLGGSTRVRSLSGDELVGRLPSNSAILFSCAAGQRALETDKAGGGHGVFFYHVIEALRGQAVDPDTGNVDWEDLTRYVRKNVNRSAREWNPEAAKLADQRSDGLLQTPHLLNNLVASPVLAHVGRPGPRQSFAESIGIKIVPIPRGYFWMGSTPAQIDLVLKQNPRLQNKDLLDEQPSHRVRITELLGVSAYEITVGQFRSFVAETGYQTEAERDGKGSLGFDPVKNDLALSQRFTWRNPGFP